MAKPCKYGPRDADGRCPKPPCKYGPRDADGYCPKKPAGAPRASTGGGAARTPGGPSRAGNPCKYGKKYVTADNPRGQIRDKETGKWRCPLQHEAGAAQVVKTIAAKSLESGTTAVVSHVITEYRKNPELVKGAVRETLDYMRKLLIPIGYWTLTLKTAWELGKIGRAEKDARVTELANATLLQTVKNYTARGHAWDDAWNQPLWKQYREWYERQLTKLSQSGGR